MLSNFGNLYESKGIYMNKAQFVELVQASGEYKTKVEAEAAIKAFTEAVTAALVKKRRCFFSWFWQFRCKPSKKR